MSASLKFIDINPLSNPKGSKRLCELCEKPAYRQCKTCRVTYYCDKEHQSVDYRGIHHLICRQLSSLRNPDPILGSEEERLEKHRLHSCKQMELLKISKQQAYRYLFEGQYELAIPAALQALRFSMDVSGDNSIDLVPSYLILGEASTGMKRYYEAEKYLSLAKWVILKSDHCEDQIRSQLYRNFGQLYAAKGDYDKALQQLALDIYHISQATNPEDVLVTGGYFQMGNVFQKQGRIDDAMAYFDKVVHIWSSVWTPTYKLDVAQAAEAIQMILAILKFRQQMNVPNMSAIREGMFALSKMYYSAGQFDKARDEGSKALEAFESSIGREHSATIEVRNFIKMIVAQIPTYTPRTRGSSPQPI
ncbi:hypothetical protein BC833DRAFT_94372 [Globomyces pollinis-pini]|nr:hypothetical protein BC833DRAFT_94372 [Globomyces pollinis-pini]